MNPLRFKKIVLSISLTLTVMLAVVISSAASAEVGTAQEDYAPGIIVVNTGADTITFATDYTITLAGSQLPAVTTVMTITGNGADNTIIKADAYALKNVAIQRANAAWAARNQGLADRYALEAGLPSQQALDTWTTRYQGMADTYTLKLAATQRANTAWAARYQGLADAYTLKLAATQQANIAWAARYQGLADAYALNNAANSQRVMAAWAARYQGLADLFASEI